MAALTDKQFILAGGVVLVGAVWLYFAGKKAVAAAADAGAGIITGNNAITQGTPYEGAGILGTLGSVANQASGGTLQSLGEKLGSWTYDVLNPEPDEIKLNALLNERIAE